MAFREKLAWISVLTMTLVYGWYFWTVFPLARAGHVDRLHYAAMLQGTIIVVVVLQVILAILVAIFSPREAARPEDERERLIALKGSRSAYFVLVTGTLLVSVCGIFFNADSVLLGNAALVAVVAANLVKDITQVVHYRLGA
jgi:heme/copper-type cytochrome/quinol oxidase subunit 2